MKTRCFLFIIFVFWTSSLSAQARSNGSDAEAQKLAVGLVQYNADHWFGDYDKNRQNLVRYADRLAKQGAKLIQFPEGSHYGYASTREAWCRTNQSSCGLLNCRDIDEAAEDFEHSPTIDFWTEWIAGREIKVVINTPEKAGNRYYNSTAVIGSEGVEWVYRKRQLYWVDQCYAQPGQEPQVVEMAGLQLGLLTCADANDETLFREYRDMGVHSILITMDWDQSAQGGPRAAKNYFRHLAKRHNVNIFVSDVSTWDGTGFYPRSGRTRERPGLPDPAVGHDGASIVFFEFSGPERSSD